LEPVSRPAPVSAAQWPAVTKPVVVENPTEQRDDPPM